MNSFSPTEAAFEGFRLMRSKPFALVGWAVFNLVAFIVLAGLLLAALGPLFIAAAAAAADPTAANPFPFNQISAWMWPAIVALVIGSVLMSAMQTAAVYRSVLRPQESGWAYLRLGGDEMRQILLAIIFALLGIVTFGVAVMVLAIAAGAVGDAGGILIGVLGGLALFCAAIFVLVRLSLAAVITFAERRISVFDSWGMTNGRFWPLLGMYLLVFVFSIVISLVGSVVGQIFLGMGLQPALTSWSAGGTGQAGDFSAFTEAGPIIIVSLIGYALVTLVLQVVQTALTFAPQASAYRQLSGVSSETTSDVFS